MNKLSIPDRAYIAGFLDGDGSIYVRLKPNKTYRFRYQIAPTIVFFQSRKERRGLELLQQKLGIGYLRDRNDGIVEYIIGDIESMIALATSILPYVQLKKRQALLLIKIFRLKEKIRTGKDFLNVCKHVDQFQQLNYSKRRVQTHDAVLKTLQSEDLLTP